MEPEAVTTAVGPGADPAPPALVLADPRVQRRNFLALMGDYILFGIAFSILNPSALPPDFVASLGGGAVLVGLAGLVFRVTWLLPQLFFAPWVNRATRKKHYVTLPALPGRLVFLPVALLMTLAGPEQPGLLIALLLGSYAALALGDGLSVLAWMDVLGSSLSNERRGWLFGSAQAVTGAIVAVLVSPLVRVILGPEGPPFPNNYALLLAIVGLLLGLALLSFVQVREGPSPPPKDSPTFRQYRTFLARVLREDAGFRQYLLTRFVYDLAAIAMPFYIVFATRVLGQPSAVALSDQILLLTVTGIVAALLLGRLNERRGPRSVIILAASAATVSPLLALSANATGVLGLHLAWIGIGLVNTAFVPGFLNWVVEYAPEGYRPIYSGLANSFSAAALLAPLLGGVIVEASSYGALFVVASALGGAALLLALRLPGLRKQATGGAARQG